MTFERRLFYYLENLKRQLRTQPLILGGVSASGGGLGAPPGGFIGQLPQSRVTFDYTEAATNDIPPSGASLLDNLNRIRYDIANLSGGSSGGASAFLDLNDVDETSYTGFEGYSVVVNTAEDGLEFVLVSGGGGSASTFLDLTDSPSAYTGHAGKSVVVKSGEAGVEFVMVSGGSGAFSYIRENVTSQVPDGSDNFDLAYTPTSGTLIVHYNGLTQEYDNYTVLASGFHTLWSPETGDELFVEYFYNNTGASVTNPTITVKSGSASYTGVSVINIEGMKVTDDGGGQVTISGGTGSGTASSGGGSIAILDEGSPVVSGATSIDFVGSQIGATADGTDVTVTVSGYMIEAPEFIGCRTYLDTNFQVTTSDGWQTIDYDAENYDTDSMWSSGGNQDVNTAGYYHVSGQITLSGNLPTTGRVQINIFKQNTTIAGNMGGYYSSASGIFTVPVAIDTIATVDDYFKIMILVEGAIQPTVLSGIDKTFLCSHMIRAVVAEVEDTPVGCSVYCNNYDNDIPDSTWTEIDYDSERYDTDTMFTAGTSHHDININTAGKYAITATSDTHSSNGSTYLIGQRIVLNGTTILATAYNESLDRGGDCCDGRALTTITDYDLAVNDVITVEIYQESGGTHNDYLRPGDGNIYITLHRIGPA